MSCEEKNSNYLKVVGKAFRAIEAMAEIPEPIRVSSLARQLQEPKTTVFRILCTLGQLGYVRQNPQTETYQLTDRASWGDRTHLRETLKEVSRPFMRRLVGLFEETTCLGVLQQGQIYYVEILQGTRSIRMAATANTYAPIHSTALGKSILAFLDPGEARRILTANPLHKCTDHTITSADVLLSNLERQVRPRGYAIDNQETEMGARCIAAPIFNSEGRPFAAISVSGARIRITGKKIGEIGLQVKDATAKISARLGLKPQFPQNLKSLSAKSPNPAQPGPSRKVRPFSKRSLRPRKQRLKRR